MADTDLSNYSLLLRLAAKSIAREEGTIKNTQGRHMAYECSSGKTTLGYGRNVDMDGGLGLTDDEAQYLLVNDTKRVYFSLVDNIQTFTSHSDTRQVVLINMCFNLGLPRFLQFKKMLAALESYNYTVASAEMLDSNWAKQVPSRARRLANSMRTGEYIKG